MISLCLKRIGSPKQLGALEMGARRSRRDRKMIPAMKAFSRKIPILFDLLRKYPLTPPSSPVGERDRVRGKGHFHGSWVAKWPWEFIESYHHLPP